MKKLILLLILLLFGVALCAQNSAYGKTIYKDYGTFKIVHENNVISISAFATIEKVLPDASGQIIMRKEQKVVKKELEPIKINQYELYLVSKSIFEGDTTSTWLYGVKIFVDEKNVLENQFPEGFVVSVKTIPTLIYTYQSNSDDVVFEIKWEKSVYEPRIRK